MTKQQRPELFKCIWGILKNKGCHLYRINGVEDHLHILTHLHPSIALANLVKDIKLGSTARIKEIGLFDDFGGWQNGYGAFTYSIKEKDVLIEYIKNQEEHHKKVDYKDEYTALLNEHGVDFDDQYLL